MFCSQQKYDSLPLQWMHQDQIECYYVSDSASVTVAAAAAAAAISASALVYVCSIYMCAKRCNVSRHLWVWVGGY